LSVIGAVSPQGGDLSEPVTQATLRIVKVFWGLDDRLAARKHFPAINWLTSYSLYTERLDDYFRAAAGPDFPEMRDEAMSILQQEAELTEIVRLVGIDSLSPRQRMILDTAKSLREDFLYQSAFHDVDTYCSQKKQYGILHAILTLHHKALQAIDEGVRIERIASLPVKEQIARARVTPEEEWPATYEKIMAAISAEIEAESGGH
jgi:V/A-type H+-transporting ATPase subunit A